MPEVRVGISGWTYPPWRGNFYPAGLPQKHELAYASRRFNALELNGSFYSLQRPASFRNWHAQTPPGFVFSMKAHKRITHERRLKDIAGTLANFFASGPLALREKLGPVLWQFPPFMRFDADRFRAFLDLLPRDTVEMARLAKKHEPWMKDRAEVEADARRPVRHAVEFRHESFMTDGFIALAREHNIAVVIADAASKFPTTEDVTADWVYIRLHGARELYASGYTSGEIEAWARKVEVWRSGGEPDGARRVSPPMSTPASVRRAGGRDLYIFFDNTDVKQRAPIDARAMAARLGVGPAGTPEDVLRDLGVTPKSATRATSKPTGRPRRRQQTGLAPHKWGSSARPRGGKARTSENARPGGKPRTRATSKTARKAARRGK